MAFPIAKFEVVEATEAPKVTKVMSDAERAAIEQYSNALKNLPAGKSLKMNLKEVGGDNPARSLGITMGHIIKNIGMSDQFTTSNDGEFYFITRKAAKAEAKAETPVANGNREPVAASR